MKERELDGRREPKVSDVRKDQKKDQVTDEETRGYNVGRGEGLVRYNLPSWRQESGGPVDVQ